MQPIVNGIEKSYSDQVEFRNINASTLEGNEIFRAFNLRGHPSYILLNPGGDIIWQGLGEITEKDLEIKLDQYIN